MAPERGTSAIHGLREQILDNAVVLYPKIVEAYAEAVGLPSIKASEAFKIITIEDRTMRVEEPDISYYGIRANLLYSPGPGSAPIRLIEGPGSADRSDALEGLLKATEHCLGVAENQVTVRPDAELDRIDVTRDRAREIEAVVDGELLEENVAYARESLG